MNELGLGRVGWSNAKIRLSSSLTGQNVKAKRERKRKKEKEKKVLI